jgi:hypothetical protein
MDGNMSQNASDMKGLLSFGCILEQLELLEMLESHIAANAPTSEAARDLAAISKDRTQVSTQVQLKHFYIPF